MSTITLTNKNITLEGREGESITATLLRAGFLMRFACRGGGCGLCRVSIDAGHTHYSATVTEQALADDQEQGTVLACLAVPDGHVTVSVPPEGRLQCVAPQVTPYAMLRCDEEGR